MKNNITFFGAAILVIIAASATSAFAQAIAFDEFGNITINGTPGAQGVIGQVPNTNVFTLCYQLPFVANAGDVFIYEPPGQSNYSDMIRFPGNNQMYVFSDILEGDPADPGALADVPFANWPGGPPATLFLNEVGAEGNNGASWVPGIGGIGDNGAGTASYNFISDGVVPEPTSLLLAGLGGALLLIVRRRREA